MRSRRRSFKLRAYITGSHIPCRRGPGLSLSRARHPRLYLVTAGRAISRMYDSKVPYKPQQFVTVRYSDSAPIRHICSSVRPTRKRQSSLRTVWNQGHLQHCRSRCLLPFKHTSGNRSSFDKRKLRNIGDVVYRPTGMKWDNIEMATTEWYVYVLYRSAVVHRSDMRLRYLTTAAVSFVHISAKPFM